MLFRGKKNHVMRNLGIISSVDQVSQIIDLRGLYKKCNPNCDVKIKLFENQNVGESVIDFTIHV